MIQFSLFPELEPPTLKELVWNRADITFENLEFLKGIELDVICKLMGIPLSGTKAKKINRILNLWDLRHTLSKYEYSHEGAKELSDFYFRVELHDMCRRAKIWRSGNKSQLSLSLLFWRDSARRKGKKFLKEAKEYRKNENHRQIRHWGVLERDRNCIF
jgi:hypothetical protein